jgi:hypothetical protein
MPLMPPRREEFEEAVTFSSTPTVMKSSIRKGISRLLRRETLAKVLGSGIARLRQRLSVTNRRQQQIFTLHVILRLVEIEAKA